VVDLARQLVEEPLELIEIGGVKCRSAQRPKLARCVIEAL